MKERQLAVAVAIYLIDKLALRVGTEKNPGYGADTVRFESYPCFPCCPSVLCENPFTRWAAAPFSASSPQPWVGFPLSWIFFCQLKFLQDQQEFVVEFDFPAKDSINYYDQVKSTYQQKNFYPS